MEPSAPAPRPLLRRAKIVCTIGPASSSESMIRELLRLGMDVARLNFSHSTHEEHARVIERLRRAAEKEGRTLAILQDLQGPKIRTGSLKSHTPVMLQPGSRVTITPRDVPGTPSLISTSYSRLAQDVAASARILLSDGLIELRVKAVHGDDVECEVVNGGLLGEHQGINLPGTEVQVPAMTEKDMKDLRFGLQHGVDLVAVSFVRRVEDVLVAKRFISGEGSQTPVIAKLEKPQAIDRLEEILEVTDGVMVARGDLGVEVEPEKVPVIQKHIIQRAAEWRKPVITATQMLESMIENPRPTRAEASDVANAVFDGTDAVMLSAETASGKYPREAVTMMGRIVAEAEKSPDTDILQRRRHDARRLSIAETICESVAHAAYDVEMRAVAVFTETGTTARLISKYRPAAPIYAFTALPQVANRLNLLWGVYPMVEPTARTGDDMARAAERELLRRHVVAAGDVIGVVAGTQMASGSTNFMRLHVVGSHDGERGAARSERRRIPRIKPSPERR
ncbi:MAG TPA: pyruvate kinase, partial [Terriglobales bacterium]|nr:pyruvate kinase [Terriglobales bacterium]